MENNCRLPGYQPYLYISVPEATVGPKGAPLLKDAEFEITWKQWLK